MPDLKAIPSWYALYTLARREKKIVHEINSLNLYEGYIPLRKVIKKWSDRVKQTDEPIFSNYVFVKSTQQDRLKLFSIPGILRFVSFGGKPITVPDVEIEKIKLLEVNGQNLELETSTSIGASVVIKKGIFAGLQGMLVKRLNNCRLIVRVPLLKQAISISIEEDELIYI